MKLIYKILLGYFLVTSVLGVFSTLTLVYYIDKNSKNIDAYREREITSFAKVIDTFISNKEALKNLDELQHLFISSTINLPHIKRLTLHAQDEKTLKYIHIVSSVENIIGTASHQKDIDAIINNKTTILYEDFKDGDRYLDITYPIVDINLKPIAALGITVSLRESDEILKKANAKMKEDTINTLLIVIAASMVLAFILSIIISKIIVSPILKLKEAATSISQHNLSKEIKISSNDEIGDLAKEFNKMSKELKYLYATMENKIFDKTKELKKQFSTDSLTGLNNRNALFNDISISKEFHVAILDVSSFKDINDAYGIAIGNKVLKELSQKYISYLLDSKLKLYRLSGDEMAILNTNAISKDRFLKTIQSIVKKIEHETFNFEDNDIEINISIHAGISFDMEHSIEKANIALIKAKTLHTDYAIFNHTEYEDNPQRRNIKIISKIKHSLDNLGIIVYYQAIVDKLHNTVKYEALVRMQDNNKILSPYFFLDISKKTKYYQEITKTVIFMALDKFKDRDELISINLCAEDIVNIDTQNFIKEQLSNFKNPSRVIFELVESEDMSELPELNKFISYIKNTGAKIAIDDFGTGYSNFAYLMDMQPDYIKIDGSLIKNIDTDARSFDIVKTIVTFSKGLNIKVIAEFIHSKEVLEVCQELGIDEFQGYYFSEPSPLK